MYEVVNMPRKFTVEINGKMIDLPDPGPDYTPAQVIKYYTNTYPELTTASMSGPTIKDGVAMYTSKPVMGTKG